MESRKNHFLLRVQYAPPPFFRTSFHPAAACCLLRASTQRNACPSNFQVPEVLEAGSCNIFFRCQPEAPNLFFLGCIAPPTTWLVVAAD